MVDRIMIVGCCGSGKSTLSKKISEKTGLPLIHLDKEYHKPNWEKPKSDEWMNKVLEICSKERWIIDGNYISSMHIRIEKADLVIFMDINRVVCLYRAVMRAVYPSKKHRSDMADGCNERHDWEFYKFIWGFNKTTRPRIIKLFEEHKEMEIIVIKGKRDILNLINRL